MRLKGISTLILWEVRSPLLLPDLCSDADLLKWLRELEVRSETEMSAEMSQEIMKGLASSSFSSNLVNILKLSIDIYFWIQKLKTAQSRQTFEISLKGLKQLTSLYLSLTLFSHYSDHNAILKDLPSSLL